MHILKHFLPQVKFSPIFTNPSPSTLFANFCKRGNFSAKTRVKQGLCRKLLAAQKHAPSKNQRTSKKCLCVCFETRLTRLMRSNIFRLKTSLFYFPIRRLTNHKNITKFTKPNLGIFPNFRYTNIDQVKNDRSV